MIGLTRIHGAGHRANINCAFDALPRAIRRRLAHVQFVCGVDPVFAGLGLYGNDAGTEDGRSYRHTGHVLYGRWHMGHRPASDRVTTIVMPVLLHPAYVVHELGHVLHEVLDFDPVPEPVTEYAKTNEREAFAEAFTAWMCPGYAKPLDPATRWLFEALAAGREAPSVRP